MKIPFHKTYTSPKSADNVRYLVNNPQEIVYQRFTKLCQDYFENIYSGYMSLMVGSCTRALELIAFSLDLNLDDEVIMPSFNYVGVANAFAQTGAKLVFADIDSTFMNITVDSIKRCLTSRSRVVVVMNYAGAGYQLKQIQEFCHIHNLVFIEDNAQGIQSSYDGKHLGSFGDFSCISFDGFKNISCGEGGLVLFKPKFAEQILTVFHNGTNRMAFEKGEVEAYEWVQLGSKFSISEFNAAILLPLLQNSASIINERRAKWNGLYDLLYKQKKLRKYLPIHLRDVQHNAHIFYLKLSDEFERNRMMKFLLDSEISCSFHYTPLHSSKMSIEKSFAMPVDKHTSPESKRLLRLPIFNNMETQQMGYIASMIDKA